MQNSLLQYWQEIAFRENLLKTDKIEFPNQLENDSKIIWVAPVAWFAKKKESLVQTLRPLWIFSRIKSRAAIPA